MKGLFKFILIFCFAQPFDAQQVVTMANLPDVLNEANIDSVQRIERIAVFKFHHLLNAYRKSKRLDTLAFSDSLWLVSRNHSIWMSANEKLSHGQVKGTASYTGNSPGQRLTYAKYTNPLVEWTGENALFNRAFKGSSSIEIAENIANESMQQWKDSPGHNANMLDKKHQMHGVAFRYNPKGVVYGTDLFAAINEQSLNNMIYKNSKKDDKSKNQNNKWSVEDIRLEQELLIKLYDLTKQLHKDLKTNHGAEKAAMHHAKYMAEVQKISHEELKTDRYYYAADVEKRMDKATLHTFSLLHPKTKLIESVTVIKAPVKGLKLDKLGQEIISALNNLDAMTTNPSFIGYGLTIIRSKDELKIYVTRILGNSLK